MRIGTFGASELEVSPLCLGRNTFLAPQAIRRAAEDTLRRLGTDHIDLYLAHVDNPGTPLAETLAAFDPLVRAGTVRYLAASNFTSVAGPRNPAQIADLLPFFTLRLTADELALLDKAGATSPATIPA